MADTEQPIPMPSSASRLRRQLTLVYNFLRISGRACMSFGAFSEDAATCGVIASENTLLSA